VLTAMPVKVVDASAVAALVFGEAEGEVVAAKLDQQHLVAPSLLGFELANICLKKCRRNPELVETLLSAFEWRDRLEIEESAVDHQRVVELALNTGLTTYDASYLWLARQLRAELVTLDRALERAAQGNQT
jgi:predicted nucleic acid-binding protein